MPSSVLTSLLTGSETGELVGLVNMTPYDGILEQAVLKMGLDQPVRTFLTLTLSTDLTVSQHTEKVLAFHLFEDKCLWKVIELE